MDSSRSESTCAARGARPRRCGAPAVARPYGGGSSRSAAARRATSRSAARPATVAGRASSDAACARRRGNRGVPRLPAPQRRTRRRTWHSRRCWSCVARRKAGGGDRRAGRRGRLPRAAARRPESRRARATRRAWSRAWARPPAASPGSPSSARAHGVLLQQPGTSPPRRRRLRRHHRADHRLAHGGLAVLERARAAPRSP